MKSLGSTLFILGVLAFGLNYMNAVPKVLAWIYEWGEDTAMWIKAGITGSGALLWLAGNFLENLQRQKPNRKKNKCHKRPSEKFQTAFLCLRQNSTYFMSESMLYRINCLFITPRVEVDFCGYNPESKHDDHTRLFLCKLPDCCTTTSRLF